MLNLCDIIIPIGPYHTEISSEAIAAAHAQTIPCGVVPIMDNDGRGAGWARNQGIMQSNALFVLFLDADDTIRPDTIERMIAHYRQGYYVYADDWQDDSLHQTSDLGYYDGTWWHSVTALVPTVYAKRVGGFNEALPALEDKDFFLRLQASGVCGVRCPHPLLHYSNLGRRSKGFTNHPDYARMKYEIRQQYEGRARTMCNCGAAVIGVIPEGKRDGDILVEALYTPMQKGGPSTGRLYPRPRGNNNYQLWVAAVDVDHPNGRKLWRPVISADPNAAPAVDDVMAMAAQAVAR